MKSLTLFIAQEKSKTNFYCISLKSVFGKNEKLIFVSTPLETSELRRFIERRTLNNPNCVSIVDSLTELTESEMKELYGLDSFARILAVINDRKDRMWMLRWVSNDTGEIYAKATADIDEVHRILRDHYEASAETIKS